MKIISILVIILIVLYFKRYFSDYELDDLHPLKTCAHKYVNKCKYLWIIPVYKNIPITEYPEWCEYIKKLKQNGKILGMHGVTHNPEDWINKNTEFLNDISENKILYGMSIFEKAFGEKPTIFKAPCYAISDINRKKIDKLGMKLFDSSGYVLRKIYHCDHNTDLWTNLFNKIVTYF